MTSNTTATAKNLTAAKTAATKARNADAALKTAAADASAALADLSSKVATGDTSVTAAQIAEAKDALDFAKLGTSAAAPALADAEAALTTASRDHAKATVEDRLMNAGDLDDSRVNVEFRAALEDVWETFSKRYAERDALIEEAMQTLRQGGVTATRNATGQGIELALVPGGYASTLAPVLMVDGERINAGAAVLRGQNIAGAFESFARSNRWI